jgi:hypothetical protein
LSIDPVKETTQILPPAFGFRRPWSSASQHTAGSGLLPQVTAKDESPVGRVNALIDVSPVDLCEEYQSEGAQNLFGRVDKQIAYADEQAIVA